MGKLHLSGIIVGAALAVSAVSGCGSDGDPEDAAATTTSTLPTTTADATTTTTDSGEADEVTSTTTASAETAITVDPDPDPDLAVAEGSGCTPGSDTLPDGRWFGGYTDLGEDALTFDLACWFFMEESEKAAAEDGDVAPSGFYIRNTNPATRDLVISDSVIVRWLPDVNFNDLAEVPLATFLAEHDQRAYQPSIWIETSDGEIDVIEEQWIP